MSDGLIDLLDRLVDTGVAAAGDVTLSVAGVDLITLRLQALLSSIGTEGAEQLEFPRRKRPERAPVRLEADEQSMQRALSQLVLVLVEVVGELMERQALRRMAAGTLDDDEVRRLGAAFVELHRRLDELGDQLIGPQSAAPAIPPKTR